jgi:uncharacterized membrane protein
MVRALADLCPTLKWFAAQFYLISFFVPFAKRGPCPDNDNCVSATAVEVLPRRLCNLLANREGFDSAATSCSVVEVRQKLCMS